MLNIVIPMAGLGSRFAKAGYELPKPLIPTKGLPMIQVVIENLKPRMDHRFIFLCQRAHLEQHDLKALFERVCDNYEVLELDGLTEGAACTVLKARQLIDNEDALMIANCDQFVDIDIDDYLSAATDAEVDGCIMTMTADDPKWSFVKINQLGFVTLVVEKEVISSEATVGIYNFSRGSDFVRAADKMIDKDFRVNGEFYVAPVYNELIEEGQKFSIYNIGADRNGMYGLGVPSDLEYFNASSIELKR